MKPLFVSMHEGQRKIHWTKLLIFCVSLLVVTSVLAAGVWHLLAGTWSFGALIVGLVFGVIAVVRMVAKAVAYQAKELESETRPHYWEFTERGLNFAYLAPERRARLDEVFRWIEDEAARTN